MKYVSIETLEFVRDMIEGKSATAIAKEKELSTSSITSKVNRYQKDLQVELFTRNQGKQLVPTYKALKILPHLNAIIKEYEYVIQIIEGQPGYLNFPALPISYFYNSKHTMIEMMKSGADYFKGVDSSYWELDQNILNNKLDLALISYPEENEKLDIICESEDNLFVLFPKDHPLARNDSLRLADCQNLLLTCGTDTAQYLNKIKKNFPQTFRKLNIKQTTIQPLELKKALSIINNSIFLTVIQQKNLIPDTHKAVLVEDLPVNRLCFCYLKANRLNENIMNLKRILEIDDIFEV